ncbi:hypothetical protein PPROV_001005100 [Pycnococcus provasolii]|uniref:Signal recognition particle subunit SRP72 n=2 Tax=Pycnococcus provasolii TaxID=41880 RepID=A0A830HX65_9CHLO|nr:hypothetical protein PPROV_001005100 [Pycnococcus provasolii]
MESLAVAIRRNDERKVNKYADDVLNNKHHDDEGAELLEEHKHTATLAKATCLIRKNNSLKTAEAILAELASDDPDARLKRAYCLYRLDEHAAALKLLDTANPAHQPLAAQLHYRLGNHADSAATYEALLTNDVDAAEDLDVRANLVAALTLAGRAADVPSVLAKFGATGGETESFELAFNLATARVAATPGVAASANEAAGELQAARVLGASNLEDLDNVELAVELAPVDVQLAYVDALAGRTASAASRLEELLKLSDSLDDDTVAVATINNVAAHLSLSSAASSNSSITADALLKRVDKLCAPRSATNLGGAPRANLRLTPVQDRALLFNRALLQHHTNKAQLARQSAAALCERFPTDAEAQLLLASCQDRGAATSSTSSRAAKAEEALRRFLETAEGAPAAAATFALAHCAAAVGDLARAASVLQGLPEAWSMLPGVVATRRAIMQIQGGGDGADGELLQEAVNYWTGIQRSGRAPSDANGAPALPDDALRHLAALRPAAAAALLERGDGATAATLYEAALADSGNDNALQAGRIHAVALVDPYRADELAEDLPELTLLDGEALEKQAPPTAAAVAAAAADGAATAEGGTAEAVAQRKKRKRKIRLPKNYQPGDPPPDPERWIPKWERAAFKKQRKRREKEMEKSGAVRGAQGKGAVDASLDASATPAAPTAVADAPARGKKGKKGRR